MRKRGWLLGAVLVAGAVALVSLRMERPRSEAPPASASAPVSARPSRPAVPQVAGLRIRGIVVDMHGRPVAKVLVSASRPEPGETLSELPCPPEARDSDATRKLPDCPPEAHAFILELASARQGGSPVHAETLTAEDGTFTLEGLPEGPLTLWALGEHGATMRPGVPSGASGVELALEEHGVIEGTVQGDGAPLSGVRVTALSSTHTRFFDATTGADGRYRVGPLPHGRYGLVFMKEAWLPELLPWEQMKPRTERDVTLHRPSTLTGRVLSPSGSPAPGVPVRVGPGPAIPGPDSRVVTADAQGRFTLALPSGKYTLAATSEGQSALVRVELGTQPLPEVALKLGSALQVHGRVLDDARRPVAGAKVTLQPMNHPYPSWEALTDEEGHYTVGPLDPGTLGFSVKAPRHRDLEEAPHTLTWGMGPLDFTLTRGPFVEGRVTDSTGRPLPGLGVLLVRLREGEAPMELYESRETTDAEGRFVMDAPTPGDYRVELSEGGYLHEPVTVQAPAREVHLIVRPGASVQGTLVDSRGLPLEAYSVRMISRGPEQGSTKSSGVTDARGHFLLQGLEPGAYWLLACQETGSVERKVWRAVELGKDARTELELRFPEERPLSGLAVDAQGRPLPGVRVYAALPEEGPQEWLKYEAPCKEGSAASVHSDPDGRFTLRQLTEPRYLLRAGLTGYTFLEARSAGGEPREPGLLVSAGAAGVRLVLKREPHVTGRVVGPDGVPLSRLEVNGRAAQDTPDGRFSVPLDETSRVRDFVLRARGMATKVFTVEPRPDADVDLGEVRMQRGRTVRGRVLDARTSQPVDAAFLEASPVDLESLSEEDAFGDRDRTAPDGSFELNALGPWAYTVEVIDVRGYRPGSVRVEAGQHEVTLRLEPLDSP